MGISINGWVEYRVEYDAGGVSSKKQRTEWKGAFPIQGIVGYTAHDLFGCLFGVSNYAQYRPLAPFRGIPRNRSSAVGEEKEDWKCAKAKSWISLEEILAIDWDEESAGDDLRMHCYRLLPGGRKPAQYAWKAGFHRSDDFTDDDHETLWKKRRLTVKTRTLYRQESNGYGRPVIRRHRYREGNKNPVSEETYEEHEFGCLPPAILHRLKKTGRHQRTITRLYVYEKVKRKDALDRNWKCLFDMMNVLGRHYTRENVRLVAWFDGGPVEPFRPEEYLGKKIEDVEKLMIRRGEITVTRCE